VISDHQPKGFSSHEALDIVRAKLPHCPFIIISGPMGEDAAVVAMRRGVDDYLVKGRLARLVPSLLNAIAAADARRERAEARDSLERLESQLRELLSHLETVVDEERKQIAGEIHDDIGGALTALRLDMNWIARNGDAASAGRAAQAMQTLSRVMDASLRLQQRLRPAGPGSGPGPALRWLVDDAGRHSDTIVDFRCTGEDATVDAATALATYRTLQESLTNIMKHAGATRVDVGLVVGPGELSLEITDNGRGIGPADCGKPTAFGLRGMEERARNLGGWVEVSSLTQREPEAGTASPQGAAHAEVGFGDGAPRQGTVVFLTLPLQAGRVPASAALPAGHRAGGSAGGKPAGAAQAAPALRAVGA
jgi:signal transduction histidine kinase